MSNVVVIGQGYVGLPMALRAAEAGHHVVGLDLNDQVVQDINSGKSHIDDVSDESLMVGLQNGYRASSDSAEIENAEVVVVCVPTPLSSDGGPDLTAVESAGREIGKYVNAGTLCILESTTYPGTTDEVFAPLVSGDAFEVGSDVFVAFSPERIDPGNVIYGVKNTPKVVGGISAECTRRAQRFYSTFIDTVVAVKGAREAEMAKLLENTFRHVNIALVNEMVRFCQELDIDLWDAIDAAETKPFGFMAFRPGPGVGGHCIPIDPSYLSHRVKAKLGYAFRMVELAEEINHAAPKYVVQRLSLILNEHRKSMMDARVLLVGVTYKPDISDQRESPAVPIATELLRLGALVEYYDPFVKTWDVVGRDGRKLSSSTDLVKSAQGADVVVILQPHSAIDFTALVRASKSVLDTRAVAPMAANVERL